MNFVSFIISSVLAVSSIQNIPDADGWVSVECRESVSEEVKDDEKDVWVVFSKKIGEEKFLVRFPDDPVYKYSLGGIDLESGSADSDLLRLRVEPRDGRGAEALLEERILQVAFIPEAFLLKKERSEDGRVLDLFYRADGKWMWERIVANQNYVYFLHTASDEMNGETHRKFVDSLDVF